MNDPRIIGHFANGQPIYSVAGGGGENDGDGDDAATDANADTATDADADADADGDEPFDEKRARAKITKVNNEARSLRERAKKAEEELDTLKDAGKTELQRATDKAAESETRAQDAEQRVLRLEVAHEKGLSPAQAKRLVGTTKEELEADADELIESFKAPEDDKGKGPGRKPKERLRGGNEPNEDPEEMDPRKLAAKVSRDRF